MTVLPLAALNDTVTVTLPASSATVTSATLNAGGGSSSVIVTVASASLIEAWATPLRVKVNVSSCSSVVSWVIGTCTVPDVSPASTVNDPDVAV